MKEDLNLNWEIKSFKELTLNEFHDIIALRIQGLIVELNCPFQDLDGKDKKCYHIICRTGKGDIIATGRIIPPGIAKDVVAIGRVVIKKEYRGRGIGRDLMQKCLEFSIFEFGNGDIAISVQKDLEGYYENHGFKSTGKEYLEEGIPHVEMLFRPMED